MTISLTENATTSSGITPPEYVFDVAPTDIDFGLEASDWDYVTIQQVSGKYETFQPYADVLADHIRSKVPSAKLKLHMTWSYRGGSPDLADNGYLSQMDMYEKIKLAYTQAIFDAACKRAPSTAWSVDGVHPTPEGHQLIADAWLDAYKTL